MSTSPSQLTKVLAADVVGVGNGPVFLRPRLENPSIRFMTNMDVRLSIAIREQVRDWGVS
jgi:hypothetical protein